MTLNLRLASLPALVLLLALSATPASFAQDAMAPAAGAMAPAADAMAPAADAMAPDAMAPMMTDEELKMCLDKAGADQAAMDTCHAMHNGDAMAPTDSMAPADAMAPVAQ